MYRYFRSIFLLTFVLALAGGALGQNNGIAGQAASVTEFEVNGLKVLLKRRAAAPTLAAGLFVRGGARNINEKNAGIEQLMLNSAVEASRKFPRQTLRRVVSRTGSSIGASAGQDFSAISMVATRESFNQMWDVFTDVAMNPAFAPEDVERTRQLIIAGLREAETSPDAALDALEHRAIYAGHPYANDVSGTIATMSSFTPAQLRDYHKDIMQTSRLLLVVVGDVDEADLRKRVAASLGKLPRGSYEEKPYPPLDFSKATLDVVQRTIQTNYVRGIFSAPSLDSPDYFAMRVAMTILQQLVNEEVRVKRQLSYAPNAELNNLGANTANIYVTANDANQAVSVMLQQIEFLKSRDISPETLDGMAGQFLTHYYLGQETNVAQVRELARYELIGGGWRNSFEFLDRINAVKPSDIRSVANKYMNNLRFVVVGNPAAVNRSIFLQAD